MKAIFSDCDRPVEIVFEDGRVLAGTLTRVHCDGADVLCNVDVGTEGKNVKLGRDRVLYIRDGVSQEVALRAEFNAEVTAAYLERYQYGISVSAFREMIERRKHFERVAIILMGLAVILVPTEAALTDWAGKLFKCKEYWREIYGAAGVRISAGELHQSATKCVDKVAGRMVLENLLGLVLTPIFVLMFSRLGKRFSLFALMVVKWQVFAAPLLLAVLFSSGGPYHRGANTVLILAQIAYCSAWAYCLYIGWKSQSILPTRSPLIWRLLRSFRS